MTKVLLTILRTNCILLSILELFKGNLLEVVSKSQIRFKGNAAIGPFEPLK
jgi:hypothetical protein